MICFIITIIIISIQCCRNEAGLLGVIWIRSSNVGVFNSLPILERISLGIVIMTPCSWVSECTVQLGVMSTYILGVDVGTTSIKAVLIETGSRAVAASHALPTTSDIIDGGGIKVSASTCRTTLSSSGTNTAVCVCLSRVCDPAVFPPYHTGQGAAHRPDHRHLEPVHRPAAQRQTAACEQHRAVRTDARGCVLERERR